MIIKSFEVKNIDLKVKKFFLFYGENQGHKNQVIKEEFKKHYKENIYYYEESEILNNEENFFENILSRSFFEQEKLIVVSRVTDKIKHIIEEIVEKKVNDLVIVLNANTLEKKSKINLLHPVYLYLERKCFVNAKSIIANSKMVKKQIINSYNINPDKINIIYNGIELKKLNYQKSYKKLSKEFAIKKKQPLLLYVGNGFKRKGVAEFLHIVSNLSSKNIKAFVVGKEKNIKYYKNLSKKLNIDSQVVFTGARLDVDDFYNISDVFLFPTHYDPFSNVVLEAMNFRNAVFTTNNNGASEILEDRFIIKNSYDQKICKSIDSLLEDKVTLEKIKSLNRKKSKLFSIERNLTETLNVINKIS